MEKYNVIEYMYDDEYYEEKLNKEPVSYEEAVAIEREGTAGYTKGDEDTYFTEIKKVK